MGKETGRADCDGAPGFHISKEGDELTEYCNSCDAPAVYRNLMSGDKLCLTDAIAACVADPFKALDMVSLKPDDWYMRALFSVAHANRIQFLESAGDIGGFGLSGLPRSADDLSTYVSKIRQIHERISRYQGEGASHIRLMKLAEELGEVMEAFIAYGAWNERKSKGNGIESVDARGKKIADELCDVIITAFVALHDWTVVPGFALTSMIDVIYDRVMTEGS